MTAITIEEALKSKQKFSEFISDFKHPLIEETLKEYQMPNGKVVLTIAELTQNYETFGKLLEDSTLENLPKSPYIVWIVVNEKEHILKQMAAINKYSTLGFGIFVFKLVLNKDKTEVECLLKPNIQTKKTRVVNTNTPAKQLQQKYWEEYRLICDEKLYRSLQIKEALPRHYQNISVGIAGYQIIQTINTVEKYVASEIAISNKSMFEFLYDLKDDIEDEVGELEWDSKPNVKSAKIRKVFKINVNDQSTHRKAILEQLKMGSELGFVIDRYLK